MTELETDRLLVREFRSSDFDAFCQYVNSDHHWRNMPIEQPPTVADAERLLEHFLETEANNPRTEYHLAAVDKLSNEFVGAVHLCTHTIPAWRQAEMGWGIVENRVGQGLAAEKTHAMLRFAFGALGLHRVQARCRAGNHASRRIMAKLGMREEGIIRDDMFIRGEWWSTVLGAILSTDPSWSAI